VTLAGDGAITKILSTNLIKDGDATTRSAKSYAPDKYGPTLPVRVLTSYQVGDDTGTNLTDLAGKSGRITIQLTVQNLTAKPRVVEYTDADGRTHSSYALVGTPLTVAAATDLANASITDIVPSGTNGVIGNGASRGGVLSSRSTGAVQWSALLAPPRLAASSTFTLVVDAHDFKVPAFDISVQPGLISDPSVESLISRAFGKGEGSRQELQLQTIAVVRDVAKVLFQAGDTLGQVSNKLRGTASQLGRESIVELRASVDRVQQSATTLKGSLASLKSSTTNGLEGTQQEANQALAAAVVQIDGLLGTPAPESTPAAAPTPDIGDATGCSDGSASVDQSGSILATVGLVKTRLDDLANVARNCRAKAIQALKDAIGTTADAPNCATSTTAYCALSRAATTVGTINTDISSFQTATNAALGVTGVDSMVNQFDTLYQSLATGVTDDLGAISGPTVSDFNGLLSSLGLIGADSGSDQLTDLQATIDQIHTIALAHDGSGPDSLEGQVADLADLVCADPGGSLADDPDFQAYRETLLDQITGTTCGPDPQALPGAASTTLTTRASDDTAAWQNVASLTSSDPSSASTQIDLVRSSIESAKNVLHGLKTGASTANGRLGDVKTSIQHLIGAAMPMTEHSDLSQPVPCTSALVDPPGAPPSALNQLRTALAAVQCQFSQITGNLASTVSTATGRVSDATTTVTNGRDHDLSQARTTVEDTVTNAEQPYEGLLTTASSGLLNQVSRRIAVQEAALETMKVTAGARIDTAVRDGIEQVTTDVGAATTETTNASQRLGADIQRVLTNLGEDKPGGAGILGILTDQSTYSDIANSNVQEQDAKATSFQNVRYADQNAYQLETTQFEQSLEGLSTFPAFGSPLPEGSTLTAVFTFHLAGN
jgi:hypothetical protein